MHLRYRLAMPLVALSLALSFAPAMAAGKKPLSAPVNQGPPPAPTSLQGSSTCTLGRPDAQSAFEWFYPSDDYYYTFIDPSTCCPDGITNLVAHWALFWRQTCTLNVQVWIVKAVDQGGGCFAPDAGNDPPDPTPDETLCGPTVIFPITGAGSVFVDHAIPLPPCACIQEPAFILWKIVDNVGCPQSMDGRTLTSPYLAVDHIAEHTPDPCVSYNEIIQGDPPSDLKDYFFANTSMWVNADCCVVKNLPSTWGKVKTLYR